MISLSVRWEQLPHISKMTNTLPEDLIGQEPDRVFEVSAFQ